MVACGPARRARAVANALPPPTLPDVRTTPSVATRQWATSVPRITTLVVSKAWPITVHLVLLLLLYSCLRGLRDKDYFPSEHALRYTWDVTHYGNIAAEGYTWNANTQSNVAFFPAFPYTWRATGLGVYGISIFNLLVFVTGFTGLATVMSLSSREILLCLSTPSLIFVFVPYSEALFFLFNVLIIYGLAGPHRTHAAGPQSHARLPDPPDGARLSVSLTPLGLFLSSTTRAASNVFLPAILLTEWLTESGTARRAFLFILSTTAGVFVAVFLQYQQTGEWLGFVKTQRYYGHYLQWIRLPLTTWGDRIYLDGAALIAGLLATGVLIRLAWHRCYYQERHRNVAFVFSLAYLSIITILSLLWSGGELFALNRHVFATGFFMVAGIAVLRTNRFDWTQFCSVFAFCLLVFSLFHFFSDVTSVLATVAAATYLSSWLFLCHREHKWSSAAWYLLYTVNLLIQAHLLDGFMSGYWVG
jgi:hypothetical protein